MLQLEWNAEHQLVKATTTRSKGPGQANRITETHYGYDALGRRMSRQSRDWIAPAGAPTDAPAPAPTPPGHSAWFVWDGNRLLQEIVVNPQAADPAQRSQTHTTVYEPDSFIPLARLSWRTAAQDTALAPPQPADWMAQRIAFFDHAQATYSQQHGLAPDDADFLQQTAQAQAGPSKAPLNPVTITWYQCDHLGTPQELTAANGDIVWQASYKTWGNTATVEWVAADGAAQTRQLADPATFEHAQVQPLRFQGQYFDAETGLHYNRFRYYDPDVGRFVSNDPIGLAGGDNIYQYAPNPIAWVDPLGLNRFKKTTWGPCSKGTGLAYTVYQQDIDWDLVHKGKTNLQRALEGGAPYLMKNGVPQQIQLHHSRQQSVGPLFEVTTSTHRAASGKGREAMHPYGNQKNPDFPVDRQQFDKDREQYWKDRSGAEQRKRNGVCQ